MGKGAPESDRVAAERHVHIINIILVVYLLVYHTSHLYIAEEIEFGKTMFYLKKAFMAAVYIVPSALKGNTNTLILAIGGICKDTDILTF